MSNDTHISNPSAITRVCLDRVDGPSGNAPETPWRAERIIFTEKVRGAAAVADAAITLATAVQHGARPWELRGSAWEQFKKHMNWD